MERITPPFNFQQQISIMTDVERFAEDPRSETTLRCFPAMKTGCALTDIPESIK